MEERDSVAAERHQPTPVDCSRQVGTELQWEEELLSSNIATMQLRLSPRTHEAVLAQSYTPARTSLLHAGCRIVKAGHAVDPRLHVSAVESWEPEGFAQP